MKSMGYSAKYYKMAENERQKRNLKNLKTQQLHTQDAKNKIPELDALLKKLSKNGSEILMAAFSGGKQIKKLEAENNSIQVEIKKLLVRNNFPENYLDTIYSCNKCKDTGIFQNKHCECVMNDIKKFQTQELNKSSSLQLCSFDTFNLNFYPETEAPIPNSRTTIRGFMRNVLNFCKNYAQNFKLPAKGIIMTGSTGLGKTHLSLAIASEVINKGYYAVYGSAPNLVRQAEEEHFGIVEYSGFVKRLRECDFLVIDDLGAEFESKFSVSLIYELINSRINQGLPTVVSTNFSFEQLQKRYNDRIVSRLSSFEILPFLGSDIRILKSSQ